MIIALTIGGKFVTIKIQNNQLLKFYTELDYEKGKN